MRNPLLHVPLNTKRQFVMARAIDGCEIYMPVDTTEHAKQVAAKHELQQYLDTQYKPRPFVA